MADMADVHRSDPLEIRVLAALMSGAGTAADVAMRTAQPEAVVGPVLEQAVAEQTLTRIDFAKTPAYSLTPKGLHVVGLHQGGHEAVDDAGRVDAGPAARLAMEQDVAAREAATDHAVPEQPGRSAEVAPVAEGPSETGVVVRSPLREVTWRHVVYAAAYVVIGSFLLLLQPVVGVVVVVAGLALGGYTLRPLWRSGSGRITSP
jgi:hypothetical protein